MTFSFFAVSESVDQALVRIAECLLAESRANASVSRIQP